MGDISNVQTPWKTNDVCNMFGVASLWSIWTLRIEISSQGKIWSDGRYLQEELECVFMIGRS